MKKGMTLIELVVVVAVIAMMIGIMMGGIDPISLFNKARDAQRKKDLNRIKIAFEDYFNDKGCYPNAVRVAAMMDKINCQKQVFMPWLVPWPCDPNNSPYNIVTGDDQNCPKWYKILTTLENKNDKAIMSDLVYKNNLGIGVTGVNYGVSSGNIALDKVVRIADQYCQNLGGCYYYPEANHCNNIDAGCVGENCYMGECSEHCRVDCCGNGCN